MRWRAAVSICSSLPSWMKRRAALTVSSRSPSPSSREVAKLAAIASRTLRSSRRLAASRSSRSACWAASRSCSAASSRVKQHTLYFLPLPQGQRSLRPGLAIGVERLLSGGTHPCTQRCWPIPDSMTSCSPSTVIWRRLAGPRAALGLQHLGPLIGKRSHARIWPAIVSWMDAHRQGSGQTPFSKFCG